MRGTRRELRSERCTVVVRFLVVLLAVVWALPVCSASADVPVRAAERVEAAALAHSGSSADPSVTADPCVEREHRQGEVECRMAFSVLPSAPGAGPAAPSQVLDVTGAFAHGREGPPEPSVVLPANRAPHLHELQVQRI